MHSTLLLCALAAPLPFPGPRDASDLQALQGEWVATRRVMWGRSSAVRGRTMLIAGDRMSYFQDGRPQTVWRITLNTKPSPQAMEWRGGEKITDRMTLLAVYRLAGDTLIIAHVEARPRARRPRDFEGNEFPEWVTEWHRKR